VIGNDCILGHGRGWKSGARKCPPRGVSRCARFRRAALTFIFLPVLFFPQTSAAQDSPDPQEKFTTRERGPIFTDVTLWTAKTMGSVNVMSTYPGQQMFALGVGLRRHLFSFPHTELRLNFEIVPWCMPSFPGANGRTFHYGGGRGPGTGL
jgi:hypothetical protein